MYYLDNAATTIPHPRVIGEMQTLYSTCFGNPSSVHTAGREAEKVLNQSRKVLSNLFHVPMAGIVFCGSGTESDNLAIKGVIQSKQSSIPHIVTTPLEHAAVTRTCEWLEKRSLAVIDRVRIDKKSGQVDPQHFAELITADTRLVSIQHVNSETGVIQDLAELTGIAKAKNPDIICHSDGVQAFGRIPVDLDQLGVDQYSISSHKFHGVKGTGALILNRKLTLDPLVHGGGQEHGLRSGTENIVGVAAMAMAAEIAVENIENNHQLLAEFSARFKRSLKKTFPNINIYDAENSIPHIISISLPGVLGEVMLNHLSEQGIYVSTGSACNATSKKLSPVLQAMGYRQERIKETVRISLAASEIPEDFDMFYNQFKDCLMDLKTL